MEWLIFLFLAISFLLFIGMANTIRALFQPGLTLSSIILKKKAVFMGLSGILFLLLALMFLNI